MQPRAAVYARVSTPEQERSGQSLAWQKRELPKLAQQAGRTVEPDDIFVEVKSGAKDDRPEYNRLMARIMEGYYQEVWVVETSRLSRTEDRGEVQRVITALQMFGCVVRTPNSSYDVSTIEGEFIYDVDSAVNRMERKRIKKRLAMGRLAKLEKGGFFGHIAPTGYKQVRDLETGKMRFQFDPEAVIPVKKTYEMALQGAGGTRILKELTRLGFRTKTGKKLSQSHVYQWLTNPAYAGYAHLGMSRNSKAKQRIMVPANYIDKPLVTLEEWETIQDLLASRKNGPKTGIFPLSSIIRCPSCGEKMIGAYKGTTVKVRYYNCQPIGNELERYCPRTQGRSIKMSVAHTLLLEAFPEILEMLEANYEKTIAEYYAAQAVRDESRQAIEAKTKRLEQIKKRIMLHYEEWENDPSEFRLERIRMLETEATTLKADIETLSKQKPKPPVAINYESISQLLPILDPTEMGILNDISRPLLTSLNYRRSGTHRKYTFQLVSCELKTGEFIRFQRVYSFSQ